MASATRLDPQHDDPSRCARPPSPPYVAKSTRCIRPAAFACKQIGSIQRKITEEVSPMGTGSESTTSGPSSTVPLPIGRNAD